MRVAIVHYHLQGGGVTRIICHLQNALAARGITSVVLTGKRPPADFPGQIRVVPGLQYEADRPGLTPEELAGQMRAAAIDALAGVPDLWHVHNHSLGKSLVLPRALRILADQGERLLLQIHDFAEDGRPGNYRTMLARMADGERRLLFHTLYPQGDHLHYVALNNRDYRYLRAAGVSSSCLHLLSNPVDLGLVPQNRPRQMPARHSPLWVYPTRAIRRKNLGEFFLWSALAPAGTRFATTSGPENPLEWPRYHRWKEVATELHLPVLLEGQGFDGASFVDMVQQADAVVTTSIAEGFGMAFLEPWSLGIPVCGRNLAEITEGFCREGIVLPWSYEQLEVPVAWLGRQRVCAAALAGLRQSYAAYGRVPSVVEEERLIAAWICNDSVDFGRLDEPMQEEIIRRVVASPVEAAHIRPSALPDPETLRGTVEPNRRLLSTSFTLKRYGLTVEDIYSKVAGSACTQPASLDGEALLDCFLAPERLALLRVD